MGCLISVRVNEGDDTSPAYASGGPSPHGPPPHGPPPHGPHHYGPPPHGPGRW